MIIDKFPSDYVQYITKYLSLKDLDNAFDAWKDVLIHDTKSFSIITQSRIIKKPYTYCLLYGIMIMELYNE